MAIIARNMSYHNIYFGSHLIIIIYYDNMIGSFQNIWIEHVQSRNNDDS